MERQLIVPALARPLHGETNGRLYSAARWFRKKRRRGPLSAQKIAAVVLFHRFVGVHEILAVGGGVARVRDELHGLAEGVFVEECHHAEKYIKSR